MDIMRVTDIMRETKLENIPGLAIFIDFKKAYDTVDWNFLFRALQAFNNISALAFKSGLEHFTPIAPAVLLTRDMHLSFSN